MAEDTMSKKDLIVGCWENHPTLDHNQVAALTNTSPDYAQRVIKELKSEKAGVIGIDRIGELKTVANAYMTAGKNSANAARFLKVGQKRFDKDLELAVKLGLVYSELGCAATCVDRTQLTKQVKSLTTEVRNLRKLEVTSQQVRTHLFELKEVSPPIPEWTLDAPNRSGVSGVPALQISDVHFAEVVKPEMVFQTNEYNIEIAKQRIRNMATNVIDVLFNHLIKPEFPGIVLCLNGDFIAGNIHDELLISNEMPVMPAFVELYGIMIWFIETMASHFGRVMIFGAAGGNHARNTKKMQFKDKAYTNFDWLLNCLLEKHFEEDDRINFNIANGSSNQFQIYGHKYRMTHGDQFRGGQGFIGPFAPITRGEIKKRSAAATYNRSYDTLVIGHFHQYMTLNRVIVNGSVVGYNEYAIDLDFPFEPPKQACWVTHPKWGITFHVPVFCENEDQSKTDKDWISWKDRGPDKF